MYNCKLEVTEDGKIFLNGVEHHCMGCFDEDDPVDDAKMKALICIAENMGFEVGEIFGYLDGELNDFDEEDF